MRNHRKLLPPAQKRSSKRLHQVNDVDYCRLKQNRFRRFTDKTNVIPLWYLSYGRSKLPKLMSPKQIMSQASIWALDQPSKLQSLLRSSLEAAEDHDRDYCETNFQNRQFLSYRHVIHIKKILRSYWLQIWNRKFIFCQKKMILDRFCKKSSCFEGEKKIDVHFFCRKKQKS